MLTFLGNEHKQLFRHMRYEAFLAVVARDNDIRKIYLVDRGEVENSGCEEGMIYFNNVLAS